MNLRTALLTLEPIIGVPYLHALRILNSPVRQSLFPAALVVLHEAHARMSHSRPPDITLAQALTHLQRYTDNRHDAQLPDISLPHLRTALHAAISITRHIANELKDRKL